MLLTSRMEVMLDGMLSVLLVRQPFEILEAIVGTVAVDVVARILTVEAAHLA